MYILSCLLKRVLNTYPLNYYMKNFNRDNSAWCITDGSAGMVSQVKGLAMAMNLEFELKEVKLSLPWSIIPVGIIPIISQTFKNIKDFNSSNLPKYIITCGRKSVFLSLFLKKIHKSNIVNIHIQNPKSNFSSFDVIISPSHDNLKNPNVINTCLAINHISKSLIDNEMISFRHFFKDYSIPLCGVLVGGKSNNYLFNKKETDKFISNLKKIKKNNNIKFFFLFSRRTDQFIITQIKKTFSETDIIWSDKNLNPYIALLGYSKYIICTSDSVSMISEAIASLKPVYIFRLKSSKVKNRIEQFINNVIERGYAREVGDIVTEFTHDYLNETDIIANKINSKFN